MAEPGGPLAAGITLYRPDGTLLDALLDAVSREVETIFLFVDGPVGEAVEEDRLDALRARASVVLLQGERNAGIACGLNMLVEAARQRGFERLFLLDQDSDLPAGLPGQLDRQMTRLLGAGERPAAIGPRPVAAPGSGTKAPRYRRRGAMRGTAAPVDFVIVSGCLLDLSAARAVGSFEERLRMDGVDVEWGFRAWAKGLSVWVDEATALPHRVGSGTIRLGPLAFPRQNEGRMENYARSQGLCLRLPQIPLGWKARTLVYLPLQIVAYAARRPARLRTAATLARAFLRGMADRPLPPAENRPRHAQAAR